MIHDTISLLQSLFTLVRDTTYHLPSFIKVVSLFFQLLTICYIFSLYLKKYKTANNRKQS
jgi:hypothetical protein